jgi:hypothetical protein
LVRYRSKFVKYKSILSAAMATIVPVIGPATAQEKKPLELHYTAGTPPKTVRAIPTKEARILPDFTVFLDPPTGFVFVKLPGGWKFVGKVGDEDGVQVPANVVTELLFGEDESEEASRTPVTEAR